MASVDPPFDDSLARRNAQILSVAQACYGIAVSVIIMLGGIVGHALAEDKSLATMPITAMMTGTMLGTIPASLFMQRFGRRAGFMLGCLFGIASGVLAAWAIIAGSFLGFCAAVQLLGYYQSTANFYRFAATDTASEAFRPSAISWTLAGGIAGALITPEIIRPTKDLLVLNAACFLAAAACAALGLLAVALIRIPRPRPQGQGGSGRPLLEIVRQPRFLAALAAGAVSYGMMILLMTATPLAMVGCGLTVADATDAIRWHAVAMFLPSFFTGLLIGRYGRIPVALAGMVLLLLCGVIALSGLSIMQFTGAMVALGLGWNLSYVSATTLVADSHRPEERGKVQAFNDLIIFGFVAFCSLMSGALLNTVGWNGVNVSLFPIVGLAMLLILLLPLLSSRGGAPVVRDASP